ncbi:hypothetical protein HHI36_017009 [Cryptolaemus montrouzieri]|uniref:Uncharacterized protein n=1 Tax=Cryptolaemus montrouzieri TaxID=559131 RepID=A0ABD2NLS5_9CUCU
MTNKVIEFALLPFFIVVPILMALLSYQAIQTKELAHALNIVPWVSCIVLLCLVGQYLQTEITAFRKKTSFSGAHIALFLGRETLFPNEILTSNFLNINFGDNSARSPYSSSLLYFSGISRVEINNREHNGYALRDLQ